MARSGGNMKKRFSIALVSALSLSPLLLYQNCGNEQVGSLYSKSTSENFPYELKIDQLAYMSCAEQNGVNNDANVFFSFRAGAYGDNSGIRLTETFNTDNKKTDNQSKMDILANDDMSLQTRIQFALRQQSSLSSMYITGGTKDGVEGADYDFSLGTIGTTEMSASLVTLPQQSWMNYWAAGGITNDSQFEGTLVFNDGEKLAQSVRNFLTTGGGILAVGFADAQTPTTLRNPYYFPITDPKKQPRVIPTNKAYGVGLKLTFAQPNSLLFGYNGAPYVSLPKRVLRGVAETNLETSVSGGQWSCPQSLQLMIVYPEDVGLSGVNCTIQDDPATLSAELQLVRKSLPVSDWYVDLANQCIVPKRYVEGSCYGIDNRTKHTNDIEYNSTQECSADVQVDKIGADGNFMRDANGAIIRTKVCPHFVSICSRLN